jgi:hypothetical protein
MCDKLGYASTAGVLMGALFRSVIATRFFLSSHHPQTLLPFENLPFAKLPAYIFALPTSSSNFFPNLKP